MFQSFNKKDVGGEYWWSRVLVVKWKERCGECVIWEKKIIQHKKIK